MQMRTRTDEFPERAVRKEAVWDAADCLSEQRNLASAFQSGGW